MRIYLEGVKSLFNELSRPKMHRQIRHGTFTFSVRLLNDQELSDIFDIR